MKLLTVAALAMCVAGCVSNPGVIADGPDAYRIMAVGSTGFTSSGSMQAKVYEQATAYCAGKGLTMETINMDSKQARPMGGYPEATLRFKCVTRTEK